MSFTPTATVTAMKLPAKKDQPKSASSKRDTKARLTAKLESIRESKGLLNTSINSDGGAEEEPVVIFNDMGGRDLRGDSQYFNLNRGSANTMQ